MYDPDVASYFRYERSENDENLQQICIYGYLLPRTAPYKYGSYKVRITVPKEFPFRRPEMQLLTPIYHPAVKNNGSSSDYCSKCCKEQWSPATMFGRMIAFFVIAIDNPEDPECYCVMDPKAKQLYEQNRTEFEANALEMVTKFSYPRSNAAIVSLKFAAKRTICKQLNFDWAKINQLPLPNSLKKYLDTSMNSN
ncbi:unnamed protein product [Adineta steineri]|uniref:UBC core domain-containing protein n=1 Tax=Adineta steineri TaxID=433720 RepID=A0A815YB10_9BILA|nr:unnamed protein product [Adineta steineri]CAF1568326.1 unnamed protein product [Adineta steineri]